MMTVHIIDVVIEAGLILSNNLTHIVQIIDRYLRLKNFIRQQFFDFHPFGAVQIFREENMKLNYQVAPRSW